MDETMKKMTKQASSLAQDATQAAGQAAQSAERMANQAATDAQRLADEVQGKDAGSLAETAQQKLSAVGSQVATQAETALSSTGEAIAGLAQTVRENAPSGTVGEYAQSTAAALEQGAEYLQQADLGDIRDDLAGFISRHPLATVLVGVGVGYLLVRANRR